MTGHGSEGMRDGIMSVADRNLPNSTGHYVCLIHNEKKLQENSDQFLKASYDYGELDHAHILWQADKTFCVN